jgi:hypothetical protein
MPPFAGYFGSAKLVAEGGNVERLRATSPVPAFSFLCRSSAADEPLVIKHEIHITLISPGGQRHALQLVTVSGSVFGRSDLSPSLWLAQHQKITFQVWFTPIAGPASATLALAIDASLSRVDLESQYPPSIRLMLCLPTTS